MAYQNQKTIYRKTIEVAQDFEIAAASDTHHEGSTDGPQLSMESMDRSTFVEEKQNPERIFGFARLPVDAQGQVRTLAKPRKLRTTKEINKLKRFLEATPYFKDLHADDATLTGIVTTATFK